MRNRVLMTILVKLATVLALTAAGAGCTAARQNRIMADTPALPYVAPDADELSGTEEVEDEEAEGDAEDSAQNSQP